MKPGSSKGKLRILVADKLRRNQNALVDPLRRRGHKVERAGNGREVLCKVFVKDYDLLIVDAHLPLMDGFQAVREIHSREVHLAKPLTIVGVVSPLRPEDQRRAQSAGMDAVLVKPVTTRSLMRVVAQVIAGAGDRDETGDIRMAEVPDAEESDSMMMDTADDSDTQLLDALSEGDDTDTKLLDVEDEDATEPFPAGGTPPNGFLAVEIPKEHEQEPAVSLNDLEATWNDVVAVAPLVPIPPPVNDLPSQPIPAAPAETSAIDVLLQGELPRTSPKKGFTIIRSDKSKEDFNPS